jgi:hypothetical protein
MPVHSYARELAASPAFLARLRGALGFALFATLTACLPPPAKDRPPETTWVTAGVLPAKLDLAPIERRPGLSEYKLAVVGQGERSVTVWMPETDRPRSVVLFLHGRVVRYQNLRSGMVPRVEPTHQRRSVPIPDGRLPDGERQTRGILPCLVAPGFDALAPVVLAPISPDGEWWKKSDTEFVLGLVQAARRRWPEAGARSIVMGYSNGGLGTWFLARLYPEYFSAAVPMAFNDTVVGPTPLPIYAIQGADDELFDAKAVARAVRALERTGQELRYDEKYRGSHYQACSYVPELKRAARWLNTHLEAPSRSAASP